MIIRFHNTASVVGFIVIVLLAASAVGSGRLPDGASVAAMFGGTNDLNAAYVELYPHFVGISTNAMAYDEVKVSCFEHNVLSNAVSHSIVTNGFWHEDGFSAKIDMFKWLTNADCIKTNIQDALYLADYAGNITAIPICHQAKPLGRVLNYNATIPCYRRRFLKAYKVVVKDLMAAGRCDLSLKTNIIKRANMSEEEIDFVFHE